ncbi:hypothetical protein, partial [Methylobacterium oxalidis]|uniref:hypothetical protein n=1 Tax=Methylobacterium oxalidis TaxID=944322 RepID=UPI0033156B57
VGAEQRDFLGRAALWRKECICVLSRVPIHSPVYVAATGIVDALDGLVEAATGDRKDAGLSRKGPYGTRIIPDLQCSEALAPVAEGPPVEA